MAKSRRSGRKQPQKRRTTAPTTRAPSAVPATPAIPEHSVIFEPVAGSPYPELLRHRGWAWWRAALGVLIAFSLYFTVLTLISQVVTALGWLVTGKPVPYGTYYGQAQRFERAAGFLGANLGIAGLIPVVAVVMILIHRTSPRWLGSVQGRVRWRYLLLCLPIAAAVFILTLVLGAVLDPGQRWAPQRGAVAFLVIILITSPLQAAAEEVFFRGYLMQALGSLVRNPWFGVITSALVFAYLHGAAQSPALFVDRLAFGLIAATLVLKTGGIEAGVAVHVVNNWLAFGIAALTSSVAQARSLTTISWSQTALDVGGFAVIAALVYLLARRLRLVTVTPPEEDSTGLGPTGPVQ